jgi:hypothetical protein
LCEPKTPSSLSPMQKNANALIRRPNVSNQTEDPVVAPITEAKTPRATRHVEAGLCQKGKGSHSDIQSRSRIVEIIQELLEVHIVIKFH